MRGKRALNSEGENHMATPQTAPSEEPRRLPEFARIRIRDGVAEPGGEVEVEPDIGRVYFQNEDNRDYRIRFWRAENGEQSGIDVLLRSFETIAIVIKRDDEFQYQIVSSHHRTEMPSGPGGSIKN